MRNEFIVATVLLVLAIAAVAFFTWPPAWYFFFVLIPILAVGIYDFFQTKHTIMRNFPIFGRGRYWAEFLRPKLQQYFIEEDLTGRPYHRINRSIIYQRAKQDLDTMPFGTRLDVYEPGYEWLPHSINALDGHHMDHDPRVLIGSPNCKKPYNASVLNVSAMSFGSLSKNAVMALNGGAQIGNFAQNTGEGGVAPYHTDPGGDLIWQIGTGYFGCRTEDGNFNPDQFKETASHQHVKMIELKLSQGAKPGHGGILPGKKVTPEIAEIRKIKMGGDVVSPPYHKAFDTPKKMLELIIQMRNLCGGKPVGFKLCIGNPLEFVSICKAIIQTKIYPDFITIDGGEGGTGAAPLEFSNAVGMPMREGLAFAYNTLVGFDLKDKITLIASGKIVTGFHMIRAFALGADACYSARAMMMALGCIQALECNTNHCPTGITTQDPELVAGLVVSDKKVRVANYHKETVTSFVELMAAMGIKKSDQLNRNHIYRRVSLNDVRTYQELYPPLSKGRLLEAALPDEYKYLIEQSTADSFAAQVA
ncbi:UNVERIFIED_CONTAM: hypothetical protein GTU68_037418 [Idotea baltica]|nr:hypothetical protein [Idotea baltica]